MLCFAFCYSYVLQSWLEAFYVVLRLLTLWNEILHFSEICEKQRHTGNGLPQLLQGQTRRRCPKSHGTLQGGESQQMNSNCVWFNLLGWGYSEPRQNSDPCLPSSFQCHNWNVLHDTTLGTVPWVCALDLAFFLLNAFAEQIIHPTPVHSVSLPFPFSTNSAFPLCPFSSGCCGLLGVQPPNQMCCKVDEISFFLHDL